MVEVDLPDDCWERVMKFLNDDKDTRHCLKSVSLVSKRFLSITNHVRSYLTISKKTRPFLTRIFDRFPNITSIKFSRFDYYGNPNKLLCHFPSNITSLNLNRQGIIPVKGLRAFSKKNKSLTSLKCSYMDTIKVTDLSLIANCFPLLEQLHLSSPATFQGDNFLDGMETLSLSLSRLRKVNLSGNGYMNDELLFRLFKNCKFLEEAILVGCIGLTNAGIGSALCERPTLRSLSLTNYFDSCATLLAVVRSCPSLSDLKFEFLKKESVEEDSNSSMEFVEISQLKSLWLARNTWLRDENIIMFASIFPNLQLLDLSYCNQISKGICQLLRGCSKIKHLNLDHCSKVKLRELDFEVPTLEVLNLSHTGIGDEELYLISKSFLRLLQLSLEECKFVTKRGVNHVVENCTQLREINLKGCYEVHKNFVASMISSRPSLRKIVVPPSYRFNDEEEEHFLSHVRLC